MKREKSWSDFKTAVASKALFMQYDVHYAGSDEYYNIWANDGDDVLVCSIVKADPAPTSSDQEDFEDNYLSKANKPSVPLTASGKPVFSPSYREGNKFQYITHDFCDKTTWWQNATCVQGETLSDSGDGLTFNMAHGSVINADRISDRDDVYEGNLMSNLSSIKWKNGFRPVFHKVYVNAVAQTTGYTVNHSTGSITFGSSQSGNTVTMDYYYATTSDYTVSPKTGKKLRIEHVEVQFDKAITDFCCAFKILVSGNEIHQRSYLQMDDYLNESNLAFGDASYPCKKGTADIRIFPWNYPASIDLSYSAGASIKLVPEDNTSEVSGKIATATLYGVEEDE